MDEAETLSNKVSIIVDGNIKVYGNLWEMKQKFGKGFEVELKLRDLPEEEIDTMVTSAGYSKKQKITLEELEKVLESF